MLGHSPQYVSQRGIYPSSHALGILHPEGEISFQDTTGLVLGWDESLHTVGRNHPSSVESSEKLPHIAGLTPKQSWQDSEDVN